MKVCLYFEGEKVIQTSGIGRAFKHQKAALESAGKLNIRLIWMMIMTSCILIRLAPIA